MKDASATCQRGCVEESGSGGQDCGVQLRLFIRRCGGGGGQGEGRGQGQVHGEGAARGKGGGGGGDGGRGRGWCAWM